MKKLLALPLTLLLITALAACQLPVPTEKAYVPPGEASPTADTVATIVAATMTAAAVGAPSGEIPPTQPPVVTETLPPEATKPPLEPSPTSPPGQPSPTATTAAPAPTNTQAGPAPEPTSAGVVFNPRNEYGPPTFTDPLNRNGYANWSDQKGNLPDTENIELAFKDNKLYVTGKKPGFSTWWFSWPELKDFYIELVVDSKQCSGKDAYGLIFRGPPHQAGISYGYVVALSCDGSYWIYRLDGVDPWRDDVLVNWKASDLIETGSNQVNMLGVQMIGDKLTVFINGKSVAQVQDGEYSSGRYGLFVHASDTVYYTYQPLELYYWEIK